MFDLDRQVTISTLVKYYKFDSLQPHKLKTLVSGKSNLIYGKNAARLLSTDAADAKNNLFVVEREPNANFAVLKLNNPPVNRLDTPLIQNLAKQFEKFEDDSTLKGVIFTSV